MFNPIVFLLLSVCFANNVMARTFDDQVWQDQVVAAGKPEIFNHYLGSKVSMPNIDCFPQGFKWGVAIAEFQNSGAARLPTPTGQRLKSVKILIHPAIRLTIGISTQKISL